MTNALTGAPSPFRATSLLQRLRQSFKIERSRRDSESACSTTDSKKDCSKWSLPRYGTLRRSSSKGPPPTLLAARRDTSPHPHDSYDKEAHEPTRLDAQTT